MIQQLNKTERMGILITGILVLLVIFLQIFAPKDHRQPWERVRFAVDLGRYDDTTRGLLTGYNWYLLDRFANDNDLEANVIIARRYESALDSLKSGAFDLVALPAIDSSWRSDSLESSIAVDSISVWVIRKGDSHMLQMIDDWIDAYHSSDEYTSVRQMFIHTYDPIRKAASGRKSKILSPYDEIIKEYADSIGWDWRLLAAVIYQESHFRLGLTSRRGAEGLMQITPATASSLGGGDMMDPREGIAAGSRYLRQLQARYKGIARNREECCKFTLAAYNAGAGRIRDCINYARYKGLDPDSWEDILGIIPDMNDESITEIDTVKLGVFKGVETINYINRVMDLYEAFKQITSF